MLAEKPIIAGDQEGMEPSLLEELLGELGSLASVYHKPSSTFVSRSRLAVQKAEDLVKQRSFMDDEARE